MCIASPTKKPKVHYRVREVEVRSGDAIDEIKFVYDDKTCWVSGQGDGQDAKPPVVLTEGEYLIKVIHEGYLNRKSAAAGVQFETNKGRLFKYWPRLATKRVCDQTTMVAAPGKEIIALKIEKGVLQEIVQQDVPAADVCHHPDEWYTVVSTCPKENADRDLRMDTFHNWAQAVGSFQQHKQQTAAKTGRSVVLINTLRNKVLKRAGNKLGIQSCLDHAILHGTLTSEECKEGSLLSSTMMLFRLLTSTRDAARFAVINFFLILSYYFELMSSVLTGHVLMSLTATTPSLGDFYVTRTVCALMSCDADSADDSHCAMILSFILVKVLQCLMYVTNVFIHHWACDVKSSELGSSVFKHVLSQDQAFFDTHTVAEIQSCMATHDLNSLITWSYPYMFCLFVKLLMLFYFIFTINVQLAIISVSFTIFVKMGVLDQISSWECIAHKTHRKLESMAHQSKDEALNMLSSIKLFSTEQQHIEEFNQSQKRYRSNVGLVVMLRCTREFGYGILNVVSFATVLFFCLRSLRESQLTPAAITSFFLLYQQVQDLLSRLVGHYDYVMQTMPSIEKFLALMAAEPALKSGSLRPEKVHGEVTFSDVRFAYPNRPGQEVLKGLSLSIKPNKVTAIVGDSGAGKSTVTSLLMRLYDPCKGTVTLDGRDLKDLDLAWLHDQVAIVNQNPALFNCSLRDNIAYGAAGVTEEQVVAAAKLSNCYDFIMGFRAGFDTYAGSRGAHLSGGQKQRIAIARAAICNPKILILDEATSALDAENERLVQEALERIMEGKAILVIAHRLSTIKSADEILFMKDGQVTEQGTHAELMAKDGAYSQMIKKQLM